MLAQPAAEHTLGGLCLLANSHKKGSSSPGPGPVFLRIAIGLFGGSLRSSNHSVGTFLCVGFSLPLCGVCLLCGSRWFIFK